MELRARGRMLASVACVVVVVLMLVAQTWRLRDDAASGARAVVDGRGMRVLIYNPGMEHMGGGERVTWNYAAELRRLGFKVVLAGSKLPTVAKLAARGFDPTFGMEQVQEEDFGTVSRQYALVFRMTTFLTFPACEARCFCVQLQQFPFEGFSNEPSLRRRQQALLASYNLTIAYSKFAQFHIQRRWKIPSEVVWPAVRLPVFAAPVAKKPFIVAVGRIFDSKRQDALVEAFARLRPQIGPEWRLVLAGGRHVSNSDVYYEKLVKSVNETPGAVMLENVDEAQLQSVLREATLFWHAMGYQRAPAMPELAEHFGMSTVEAMHCGVVPVVCGDGGQMEIVTPEVGRTWRTLDDLVRQSRELIEDRAQWQRLSEGSRRAAQQYGPATFSAKVEGIVQRLLDSARVTGEAGAALH